MKEYTSENIRNVAFLGHGGSGKSTMVEAMLFRNKALERMGRNEDGTLASDYDPEEKKRNCSINTTIVPVELKDGVKINIIDCPGNRDFVGEVRSGVWAAEAAVVFIDAASGIQVGTELAMETVTERNLPVLMFVNKLDKENATLEGICDQVTEAFGKKAVPMILPVGKEADLKGVVGLNRLKFLEETPDSVKPGEVPADMADQVAQGRVEIVEAAAEANETLMNKYFEEGELTEDEMREGLRQAFQQGSFIPVFCGSALSGVGVDSLLKFLREEAPSPLEGIGLPVVKGEETEAMKVSPDGEFAAFCFKTVSDDFAGRLNYLKIMSGKLASGQTMENHQKGKAEKVAHVLVPNGRKQDEVAHVNAGDIAVLSKLADTATNDTLGEVKKDITFAPISFPQRTSFVAVSAEDQKDEDKIGMALHNLAEQDPTLNVERDPELRQTILSGMGEQHLDVAIARATEKTKAQIGRSQPRIRYRETITKKAEGTYRHKKQSGGRGQFAEVSIRVEPCKDEDYKFTWSVFGGAIPTNFSSAVDKGAQMSLDKGILAGNRVVGVHVDCYDGKHHPVDSSDMAFQIASGQAFKQITQEAGPQILEPICLVTTTVPEANMGDVMGDVSQRRGRIQGSDNVGNKVVVKAMVPEAEMQTYAQNLRSMTGGRGVFEREFSHYEPVPGDVQQRIIEESKQEHEEEA